VVLKAELARAMFAHALAEQPNEACGILAGSGGEPVYFYPAANAEHSPTRYVVEPQDQLRIQRELDASDWDLLGIFHSHTHTQAYPSSTDIQLASNWPDQIYLIASLMNPEPQLRAFRIVDGQVSEEEIDFWD